MVVGEVLPCGHELSSDGTILEFKSSACCAALQSISPSSGVLQVSYRLEAMTWRFHVFEQLIFFEFGIYHCKLSSAKTRSEL